MFVSLAFARALTRSLQRRDALLDLLAQLVVLRHLEETLEGFERALVVAQAIRSQAQVEQQLGPAAQRIRVLEAIGRVFEAPGCERLLAILERTLGARDVCSVRARLARWRAQCRRTELLGSFP